MEQVNGFNIEETKCIISTTPYGQKLQIREFVRSVAIQDIGENIANLQRGADFAHRGPMLHVHARDTQIFVKDNPIASSRRTTPETFG